MTLRKRSGGPFLVKSGERYASPRPKRLQKESLRPWTLGSRSPPAQKRVVRTSVQNHSFIVREMGLEPTRRCHH